VKALVLSANSCVHLLQFLLLLTVSASYVVVIKTTVFLWRLAEIMLLRTKF